MRTLPIIFLLLFFCCFSTVEAQQLSFENINSSNALNIITQIAPETSANVGAQTQVLQYGNMNYAELSTNGGTTLQVQQLGDYNFLNFDNSFNAQKTNSVITTKGDNNIVDVVGSNSISEKIQIHVQGDNMTLFMRNF